MRLAIPPELIEAARDSSGDAMERLLRMLWPHAFRIARSIVQDRGLAEDAAQEACALIYRQLAQLRNADAFRVWAYRIVIREALRATRRIAQSNNSPAAVYEMDVDTHIDLLSALAQLPPKLRAAIVLHYYAEFNSTEIGKSLGIPSATVRFHLARARQRLKRILDAENRFATLVEVSQ